MRKKFTSVVLAAAVGAMAFTGCGNSEEVSEKKTVEGESADTSEDEEDEEDEEMKEINIALVSFAQGDESTTKDVVAKVNEITEKKINVHVDITWYDPGTYGTQVPMILQANEKLDVLSFTPIPGTSYTSFMSQKQLKNISAEIEKYGSDIKEKVGQYMTAMSGNDGGVYALPYYGPYTGYEYISMRKDILDELGLTEKAQNMKSWSEYKEILTAVKEKTDLAPVVNADQAGTTLEGSPYINGTDEFSGDYSYDSLGDGNFLVIADEKTDKLSSRYQSEDMYNTYKRANEFYKAGLIYKDAATSQDAGDTLIKNGVGFSDISGSEVGIEGTKVSNTGYECVCVPVTPGVIAGSSLTTWGLAVATTSTEPEAAVKFLNLVYSDTELVNTLTWGVEGRDWVLNDKGQATFPEGITIENVKYHQADFLYGNKFGVTPWDSEAENIRELQMKSNEDARVSKYLGFIVNNEGVESEVTACVNAINEYKPQLASGSCDDFEKTYKEFKNKLTAAGIDKIIETYQKQLDEWLANK